MLAERERLPQPLELRAEASQLEDARERGGAVQAAERGLARTRHEPAGEHVDRGGLARAVGPEQREARAVGDGERQVVHRRHRRPAEPG